MTTVLGQDAAVEGDHQRDSLARALFQMDTVRRCVEMKGRGVPILCWLLSSRRPRAYLTPPCSRRMTLLHYDFRRFLDALDDLNPAQIEDA